MISPNDTCRYVQQQLPEISGALPQEGNMYATLHAMREYACQKVQEHDFSRLKECFSTAGALYENGTTTVRSAVENIVVYSLSRMFNIAPEARQEIKSIMPRNLHTLYVNQVLDHGY